MKPRASMGAAGARRRAALAILREADDALDGWSCDASTDCCRFAVTGREPWLTPVEWELVVDEVKRTGRRLPRVPDDDDERCPFLSPEGRCLVYAARPLGCRTFYCERATGPAPPPTRALRALPRRLAALGADDARPLRSWLSAASLRHPRRR